MRKLLVSRLRREFVTPVLASALVSLTFLITGCTVKAQVTTGDDTPKKTQPKAKPKPKRKLNLKGIVKKKHEVELPAPVPFKTGSAELDEDAGADEILELVKIYMEEHREVTLLRVEGHTDSDGDDNSNMQLSKDRAASVTKWLVDHGVKCNRLMPVGFGETRPLAANDTPENKAKNRRVSFFDATENGKPVKDDKGADIPVDNGGQVAVDPCNPAVKR